MIPKTKKELQEYYKKADLVFLGIHWGLAIGFVISLITLGIIMKMR